MDIELLAAWGEFIGGISGVVSALAMIASLVFVGLQIRQHTLAVRSSTRSEIALAQIDTNYRLAKDPALLAAGYGLTAPANGPIA